MEITEITHLITSVTQAVLRTPTTVNKNQIADLTLVYTSQANVGALEFRLTESNTNWEHFPPSNEQPQSGRKQSEPYSGNSLCVIDLGQVILKVV
jgi:hypothetical protein